MFINNDVNKEMAQMVIATIHMDAEKVQAIYKENASDCPKLQQHITDVVINVLNANKGWIRFSSLLARELGVEENLNIQSILPRMMNDVIQHMCYQGLCDRKDFLGVVRGKKQQRVDYGFRWTMLGQKMQEEIHKQSARNATSRAKLEE